MVTNHKKIYLLVASNLPFLQKRDWLESMPELNIIADVEPIVVFNEPSCDITPEVWLKLAQAISNHFNQADGFVILHDIDNILYTGSALSFLLQNLTKPVIITGPYQKKSDIKHSEIRANIINACQAAGFNFGEVVLMFGNRLLRANQSWLTVEESLNVFNAPVSGVLGRIDFSIRIFDKNILNNKGQLKSFDELNNNFAILDVLPTINLKSLAKQVADKDGVLVKAFPYQNLPNDLVFFLGKITQDIPVVIWTKQLEQPVLASKNLFLINNLTWEATLTKLMWALTQSRQVKKVKELMTKYVAGEIIIN